jgi:hypothetical protein
MAYPPPSSRHSGNFHAEQPRSTLIGATTVIAVLRRLRFAHLLPRSNTNEPAPSAGSPEDSMI